ncbi:MAG: hypothetical protein R2843_07105 [Thermomicrobiales bacterium]
MTLSAKSLTENAEAIQSLEATTLELVGATRDSSDKNIELERLQEDTYFSSYVPEELHHKRRKSALSLDAFLKPYLHGHPEELQRFVRKNLINCIALYFGEELKSDTKTARISAPRDRQHDCRIRTGQATQAKQHAEMMPKLIAITERLATEPVENVQSDGLAGLDNVIRECRDAVIAVVHRKDARLVTLFGHRKRHFPVKLTSTTKLKWAT